MILWLDESEYTKMSATASAGTKAFLSLGPVCSPYLVVLVSQQSS